jgi:hypothetical protein
MMVGEGWFRTLIEAAPDIYFRYDFVLLRGFAYVSPAIKTAIGYAPDDFGRDPAFCVGLVHAKIVTGCDRSFALGAH